MATSFEVIEFNLVIAFFHLLFRVSNVSVDLLHMPFGQITAITKHVVPYWLSDVVIVEAFGEEVSGRSHDHIVHYFTNFLSAKTL